MVSVNVATVAVNDWPATALTFCPSAVIRGGGGATVIRLRASAEALATLSVIVVPTMKN